jgi:hypothetical protein
MPEAPYLFSVAALSVTLAAFAGLVAAFRRGGEWTAMTVFRLREIAEFGLGNALITLPLIPLATTLGDLATALRICGAVGVLFVVAQSLVLIRRQGSLALPRDSVGMWSPAPSTSARSGPVSPRRSPGRSGSSSGSSCSCWRPMLAFALVIASLRHE